ncbi:MAG: magnesium transporter [Planctomycetes bacterium]|nr:magnesium transporter [Planctomycetota bacterium]
MPNTLYLPELREMLANDDRAELAEFCVALHSARTAEFMEGLTASESWAVLQHTDATNREEIFGYFEQDKQIDMLETLDRTEMGQLIGDLPPDDRVDLLQEVDPQVVKELLPLVPAEERRDILRLQAYPEDTAGAVMTTELARLSESLTVREALEEIGRQARELETIYYIYIVDDENHLRGLVSARQLVAAMGHDETLIGELMERDLVTANVGDDQEDVARTVARYDLLAIPVIDQEHHLVGIITHDDVIDVVREEAAEDAHRFGAIDPLDVGYLQTSILTLIWKRGMWLVLLLFAALFTAFALDRYEGDLNKWKWLVLFIPLVISSGGNSGSQSATLVITGLTMGHITLDDWLRIALRELAQGLLLGGVLAAIAYVAAAVLIGDAASALVVPVTVLLVVVCGTLTGSLLPLLFRRFGLDPAMMSTPFVAAIIDIVGVVIYMQVALAIL